MNSLIFILRIFAAIVLAALWVVAFPIQGEPFGGCEVSGYLTLQPGCSNWPHFIQGFGFVLIAAVIAPEQTRPQYVALVVVLIISLIGGLEGLKFGSLHDISNLGDMVAMFTSVVPLIVGGVVAFIVNLIGRAITNENKFSGAA